MIEIMKKYSKCFFAIFIAALIITASLCFLAHSEASEGVSEISFSASQIYEMTESDEDDADISSKIGEELSDLFES